MHATTWSFSLPCAILTLLAGVGISSADDKPVGTATKTPATTDPAVTKDSDDERRDEALRAAAEYEFSFDNGPKAPIALRAEPILRWPNHERGAVQGGTFLWTARGNPVAMCDLFWHRDGRHFAFHSLTGEPIMAEISGRKIWHARQPGVELKPLPGAPAPAASPVARLAQMRNMARDFQAATLDENDQDAEQLRLLTQPLYRYESTDPIVADGALFAFVTGTDPEVILQIEARNGDKQGAVWQYGLTRRSAFPLRARQRETIIWSVPAGRGEIDEVYYEK
jgi:hypothetical protein